ncbi:NF038104 family lipoprotein [Psychrobacter urativorans]|uniref:NF038104 family lipoprotein n=1 Tax=Psychrobacter urativorans TaxID=45610 RepID=UPI00191B028D|nr:NF038104 family lipoprotein [Psychrobacter urativorans]
MKKLSLIALLASIFLLQACVHKIVTVPVKVAYKTTKGVVKGTAAVTKAIIPGGDEDDNEGKRNKKNKK